MVLRAWWMGALVVALAAPAQATRIFVAPVQADDAAVATTWGAAVESALHEALPGVELVTRQALDAVVAVENARDCLAVDGVTSCLSELADALDVDFLARASYGRLGAQHVLTVSLVDGRRAVVVAQGQRSAVDPEVLWETVPGLVREVLEGAGLLARPPSLLGPGVVVGAGVGVALLGAGAWLLREELAPAYAAGRFDRSQARLFEAVEAPMLYGGLGAVVVGSVVALVGVGLGAWIVASADAPPPVASTGSP
jgi:hypothetical protein